MENIPARRGLHVFCPHRTVGAVTDIDMGDLRKHDIKGIILDLDNTLVRWRQEEMTDEVIEWLSSLQAQGFKLCILSNSILSRRSERIANRLGCSFVRKARKPSRRGFHKAIAAMGTTISTTAIIGDQVFTDIWGGNRVGIYTILVKPMHSREFVVTRYVHRPPERLLLRYFRRRGHI